MKTRTLFLFPIFLLMVAGCKKDQGGPGAMTIWMSDGPADYKSVNVDISCFDIRYDDGASVAGWQSLTTKSGICDMLALNDSCGSWLTLDQMLRPGRINCIRLRIGSRNTLITSEGDTVKLALADGIRDGVLIPVNTTISADYKLELQFDIDMKKSVIQQESNYTFNPEITLKRISFR